MKKRIIQAIHHVSLTGDAAVKFVLVALVVLGGRATTPAVLVGGAMIVGEVLLDDCPDESSSFLLLSSFVEGLLADFSEPFPAVSSLVTNKVVVVTTTTTTTTRKRRTRRPIDHPTTHRFRLSAGCRRRLVPV
jgi:hypothetical protein